MAEKKKAFRLAALGDVAFCGKLSSFVDPKVFAGVQDLLGGADLAIANLEGPLTKISGGVPGKCALRGEPDWANALKDCGISLVTLANNHTMDFGREGLADTLENLEHAGIAATGAGPDVQGAESPLFLELCGHRLAVLARTSVEVSSPSYAGSSEPGVAFYDHEDTCSQLARCKTEADIVILLIHWGIEEYIYPSPRQRQLARELVEAGADLILGHHPHVLQGIERIGNSYVVYSLGNFLFNDIEWQAPDSNGAQITLTHKLNQLNREGMILFFDISENSGITFSEVEYTAIAPDGRVLSDHGFERARFFEKTNRALHRRAYGFFWQLYSMQREWQLRIKPVLFPEGWFYKLKKIRMRHFVALAQKMSKAVKMASGKTTNPYE